MTATMAGVTRPAYSFVRDFDAAAPRRLCVDRHYLLYAARGALRLEFDGTTWSLPPARAALIRAGVGIEVTIPQRVTTSSVLFSVDFMSMPRAALVVFDMTPLAKALVHECARWGDEEGELDDYAIAMFQALAQAALELAERPSPARMPSGRTVEVRRALEVTAAELRSGLRFDEVSREVGLSPRSLARRFEDELGMSWRASMRRIRVLRAIELLAGSDRTVTQIASEVGYGSLSAFNAAFRDVVGRTPTEYRDGFRP